MNPPSHVKKNKNKKSKNKDKKIKKKKNLRQPVNVKYKCSNKLQKEQHQKQQQDYTFHILIQASSSLDRERFLESCATITNSSLKIYHLFFHTNHGKVHLLLYTRKDLLPNNIQGEIQLQSQDIRQIEQTGFPADLSVLTFASPTTSRFRT